MFDVSPACDAWPAATALATNAWVKYCRPAMTPMTTANRITGRDRRQRDVAEPPRTADAPSISAASYSWRGTSRTAARKMTIVLPTAQTLRMTSDGFDHAGSLNHSGPSMPTLAERPC